MSHPGSNCCSFFCSLTDWTFFTPSFFQNWLRSLLFPSTLILNQLLSTHVRLKIFQCEINIFWKKILIQLNFFYPIGEEIFENGLLDTSVSLLKQGHVYSKSRQHICVSSFLSFVTCSYINNRLTFSFISFIYSRSLVL